MLLLECIYTVPHEYINNVIFKQLKCEMPQNKSTLIDGFDGWMDGPLRMMVDKARVRVWMNVCLRV